MAVMKQKLKETETRRERTPAKKGTRANEVEMELEDARDAEIKGKKKNSRGVGKNIKFFHQQIHIN
jgi:hypothetical protein